PQVLVANTRLLTPDNQLFRISQRVEIPVGGQVEVWAQADQPGTEYISQPTNLTIPGLWEGLQSMIYAQSKDGLKMQSIPKYTVSQNNLDTVEQQIKNQAETEALTKINSLLPDNLKITPDRLFINYQTISASPLNQESAQTTLRQKITAHGLIFDQSDLVKASQEKFQNQLQGNEALLDFDDKNITYRVLEMNSEKGEVILEVAVSGFISSQAGHIAVDKEKIIGLSQEEIAAYLNSVGIDRFQIYFFPRWLKTAPKFTDHIIIK
ncbi:MAG: hypothetical protein PHO91_02360, partial [Patescibacteria group bacterium]|nr:hypothetical protein [Patescibacteria group bacterium]